MVKRIAYLSVIAITVSVTAFFVVLFVMNGMNENIETRILAIEPHVVVQADRKDQEPQLKDEKLVEFIRDNAKEFSAFDTQDVILRTFEGQFRGAVARGVSRDSLIRLNQKILELREKKGTVKGLTWDARDLPEEGEILIGIDLARALNILEGDFITVITPESLLMAPGEAPRLERVRVRKIISTDLPDIDTQNIFYQRGYALNLFSSSLSRKSGYEVWLAQGKNAESFKKKLSKLTSLPVETWIDRNSVMFFALKLEKFMIGLFLGLAGLIAGSSVLTVLTLLISEKRRDIAILKTLGLSTQKAIRTFTQIGCTLAGVGLGVGAILGLAISLYIENNPIMIESEIYYDPQIPARVSWILFILVMIGGAALSWFGSYWPARASRDISPAQTLKMKN